MRRTWLLTPLVFLLLILFGFNNTIARFVDASTGNASLQPSIVVGPDGALVASNGQLQSATPQPTPMAFIQSPTAGVTAATTMASPSANAAVPQSTPAPPFGSVTTVAPWVPSQTARFSVAVTPTIPPPTAGAAAPPRNTSSGPAGGKSVLSPAPIRPELAPRRIGNERVPTVGAKEFVIIDGESGSVLAELNAHRQVAPASTTKIVTALVALARSNPADVVNARFDTSELIDSTLMGLRQNDQVTLEDLLFGLMLPSGNDAALAIANHVAGSKTAFVGMMNQLASDLQLRDSHFTNPHGLDENGHYSSAYDMVQFARAGMNDARFYSLSSSRSRVVHMGSRTVEIFNLNRVLSNVNGADGIKIGYTEDAGRTIVASVTRSGRKIYVGAFHASDLVADCRPLFEWAFRNFSWSDLPIQGNAQ